MSVDRFGTEVLETNVCWELLRATEVGRLAVSITDHPDIFPVNYVVDHGTVVFRTAEGTKLAASVLGRAVAFEIDGYDPEHGDAWSVVIKGQATRDRTDAGRLRRPRPARCSRGTPPPSTASCASSRSTSSGRRFHVAAARPKAHDGVRAREMTHHPITTENEVHR